LHGTGSALNLDIEARLAAFFCPSSWAARAGEVKAPMSILDLTKATVTCGALAFLIYTFPVIGQVLIIGFLTFLWLAYARKTILALRRR
jgi:hypothetical protein